MSEIKEFNFNKRQMRSFNDHVKMNAVDVGTSIKESQEMMIELIKMGLVSFDENGVLLA